ncbi:MAG TPA: hypothetical protein VFQ53_35545 [Kofleriaceae bacterium]|nr:hypothetical protein [Kofleriaceae bacterium]
MQFPAPPAPTFVPEQAVTTDGYLRYEDVTQDGRLMPIAVPPALGGLWRGVLVRHPGARAHQKAGVIPLLTRLTIVTHDQRIRVDKPTQSRAGFELARDEDAAGEITRLYMNVWCELHGTAGRIVPPEPAGSLALAGQLFAEHTFTRPFAPPDKRRVTRLTAGGYPELPDARYAAPAATSAGEPPEGARWLDELAPDPTEVAFTLDQTDSNQHVNSLVYIRVFLEAVQRRLAAGGHPLKLRSRAVDIAYRKPCFAGDRARAHVRLFGDGQTLGAAGHIVGTDDKPRCYVRVLLAP